MRQIVEASEGQYRILFAVLAGTGMRVGEVFGLHAEDLDLEAGQIRVQRSVWKGRDVSTKTKRGQRTLNIEPVLVEMLRQHLAGRATGRVFQTRNGTPFSQNNVRRVLDVILCELGLKPGGFHAFRHGRVSILQEKGVPGDLIREWIGHTSLRTTSRYTHIRPEFRQQVAADVGLFKPMLVSKKVEVS